MGETPGAGRLGIGVIGAGAMGTAHARELAASVPGVEVRAVYDADDERSAALATEIGAVAAVHHEAVIGSEQVDAVVIAAPDPWHEELVLACLAAGKHVLCEKPLAVTAQGTRRIVEAEVTLGRRLVQVGFMRRFDPALVALADAVSRGEVGRPRVVHCVHRNAAPHPSATSEGVISNSMIHELDQVPWLLGERMTAITVTAPWPGEVGGLLDTQVAVIETAGGAIATVEVSVNAGYGYDVRCEVVGEQGTVRLSAPYGLLTRHAGHDGALVGQDFVARFVEAYRRELTAWTHAIRSGVPIGPSAWDGHLASVAAEAGVRSLLGAGRVEIPHETTPVLYK
jgi:myo-inositol 2-dehydrogenase / D-chiro-inositol 1-dehydrogenase